jgi:hypothetical protein
MSYVKCTHCGSVYDMGHVEVTARYADCSMWKAPCCGSLVDSRTGGAFGGRGDYTELSAEQNEQLVEQGEYLSVSYSGTYMIPRPTRFAPGHHPSELEERRRQQEAERAEHRQWYEAHVSELMAQRREGLIR